MLPEEKIVLQDGLIINQEDDNNRWLLEAIVDKKYKTFLQKIKKKEEIILEVKITKETNEPAYFRSKVVSINEIDEWLEVIFEGVIVDRQQSKTEQKLANLIEEGYEGEQLLEQFIKAVRS